LKRQFETTAPTISLLRDTKCASWRKDGLCIGLCPLRTRLIDSDHCEWENFESIFHPDAFVYTTWTGRTAIADFMNASKAGMDRGAFIMHRIHGTSVDLQGNRAVAKMKATITQRFNLENCLVDAESDCRFCMFFEKRDGKWGAAYVRHWYEKDK